LLLIRIIFLIRVVGLTFLDAGSRIFFEWFFLQILSVNFNFVIFFDIYSLLFLFGVSLIRIRVIIFRKSYILREKFLGRFNLLVLIFICRMYLLILSPNLVRMLLGWDGLGLRSYLLVIYYSSQKSFNSGIITAISNRVGDLLILFTLSCYLLNFSYDFIRVSLKSRKFWFLVIIVAASTKSAQIPFSAWLPAAIAAPTPVSALVHSSTLVTAGVYLLLRHDFIFLNKFCLKFIFYLGLLTCLIARVRALKEVDLKKIVALSTLRQLGVIIILLGIGAGRVCFLHLLAHAFFKALIFIGTGHIIHRANQGQDIRFIGIKLKEISSRKRFILLRIISLIGLPFISAFYSKEVLIEVLYINLFRFFDFLIFWTRVVLTRIYSMRYIYFFFSKVQKSERSFFTIEWDSLIYLSGLILLIPAIFGGKLLFGVILKELINNSLSWRVFLLIIFLVLLRIRLIRIFYLKILKLKKIIHRVFFFRIWGLRIFSRKIGSGVALYISFNFLKFFEKGYLLRWRKNFSYLNFYFLYLSSRMSRWLFFFIIWLIFFYIYYLNNKLLKRV